jgi:restriction system protein
VGFDLVQRLYGAFASQGATHAMLVTTSTFTGSAREFQLKHRYQLTLREYADVVKWINEYGSQH